MPSVFPDPELYLHPQLTVALDVSVPFHLSSLKVTFKDSEHPSLRELLGQVCT